MEQNLVVSISRQYGSGGREIGFRLAERLGIPFYDKEIVALAARESGVSGAFFTEPEQDGGYLLRDFTAGIPRGLSIGDKVYVARHSAVRALAEKGPCVIVGCGAGGALKDIVPLLNVFVYAELKVRKQRAIQEYGDSAQKIEERIAAIDKKRAAYFRFYSGLDGGQMGNYQLCFDSGAIGIDGAVTLLETAYLLRRKV